MKFSTKYRIRSIIGKPVRTIIIIIGICMGSLVFLYAYGVADSLASYVNESVDKIGNLEYQYYFNEIKNGTPDEGVAVAALSFECGDSKSSTTVMGMEENDLMSTKLVGGSQADLSDDKYYITNMGATVYGVKAGDKLVLRNMSSLEETEITIDGIVDNDSQNAIFTSRENACKLGDLPDESYTLLLSDKKLDYKESELSQTITKASLTEQINEVYELVSSEVGIMVPFGLILCVFIIYIMVNMVVSENKSSISMLKVLGYRNHEINRITINIYHYVVPIGMIVGIIVSYVVLSAYFAANTASFNTYVATHFSAKTIGIYIILILASYIISLLLLGRKVGRVGMSESLKDNRE